jgi:hypothetical protein
VRVKSRTTRHHVAHQRRVAGEQEAVEHRVGIACGERPGAVVEDQSAGEMAHPAS